MNNYEYILTLRDKVSDTMKKVTGSSLEANSKFTKLRENTKILDRSVKDFGGSLSTLRQKMDLLRQERDLISPKNLKSIRQYNSEIKGLSKEITKLETINGSKFKNNIKAAFAEIPAILRNPVTMGLAAVGFAGKSAMGFDEGMAKVNTTAQMGDQDFDILKSKVKNIAKRNKADMSIAPIGFEKIISQTGDAEVSLSILDSALKGSKAGFTDLDTVSGALAQTLSIVGKENTTAQEVLDTFFAAKRVGAGEFKDFANYMPGLIAGADALGVKYKDVAGIFAYMTGKGQSAERASVLMTNMFSVLGKTDITTKLSKVGVNIFDKAGKMRSVVDIFKDLNALTTTMSDEQKTKFLDKIGIVDKEAKASFAIMASDVTKLSTALGDCNNSIGETEKALAFSRNSMQRATELWNQFKNVGVEIGGYLLPVINAGMSVLGGILSIVSPVLEGIVAATSWWFEKLGEGNPLIWGTTAALGAALILWKAHAFWLKLVSLWNGIVAATTGGLSKAMTALKTSFLTTPWGLAIMGAAALVGGLVAIMCQTDAVAKSFAQFNSELSRNRKETKGAFEAATTATQGSEARAAAIKKINEQYGEYLPALLTEKSSNDELSSALNLVNIELERKIRIKHKNAAIEAAMTNLDEIEEAIFEYVAEQVQPDMLPKVAAELRAELDKLKEGKTSWDAIQKGLGDRYDLSGWMGKSVIGGGAQMSEDGKVADAFGKRILEYAGELSKYTSTLAVIEARFAETPKVPNVTNNITVPSTLFNYLPLLQGQKATDFSFYQSSQKSEPNSQTPDVNKKDATTPTVTFDQLMGNISSSGGGKGTRLNSIDLDKIAPQALKGTTSYGAIASKIASIRLPSLAKAAATFALPLTMASTKLPNVNPLADTADRTEYAAQNDMDKFIAPAKFCDKIEIHIASADGKGYDQISSELMEVIGKVMGGDYEA